MDRIAVVDMPEEMWDRLMRINLKGVFLCAQAAAKHMIPRKEGRILSIASGRGVAGQPRSAHYAASKAGVIAFTKSLAVELAADNITVNCVMSRRDGYADVAHRLHARSIQETRGNPAADGRPHP